MYWFKLITEVLSFLHIFSVRKQPLSFFTISENLRENRQKNYISGIFRAFKSKLQIIPAATYIALFLPDSNKCFFICLVSYIPIHIIPIHIILCSYFYHIFLALLATRRILQFTMFDSILLEPARNSTEIKKRHFIIHHKRKSVAFIITKTNNDIWFNGWVFPPSLSNYFLFSFWSG